MKILLAIISLLFIAAVIYLFTIAYLSKSTPIPGLVSNQLTKCSAKPNCVCSEYKSDTAHFIEPIKYSMTDNSELSSNIKNIIQSMNGNLIFETNLYIAATFKSKLFGFTDDFEIRIDSENKLIHVRSASRVGRSDMGKNKKRVIEFTNKFSAISK